MANDGAAPSQPMSRQERQLVIAASIGTAALLLGSVALWLRYGESVYTSRILSMIANCL
jgi:hypothetical protein